MTSTLAELTEKVCMVSDSYARECGIERDDDWYLLKLQEELGELGAEHLRNTGRGRRDGEHAGNAREKLENETADVFAQLLLFAEHNAIDLEASLARKWFRYLDAHSTP